MMLRIENKQGLYNMSFNATVRKRLRTVKLYLEFLFSRIGREKEMTPG